MEYAIAPVITPSTDLPIVQFCKDGVTVEEPVNEPTNIEWTSVHSLKSQPSALKLPEPKFGILRNMSSAFFTLLIFQLDKSMSLPDTFVFIKRPFIAVTLETFHPLILPLTLSEAISSLIHELTAVCRSALFIGKKVSSSKVHPLSVRSS